MEGSDADGTAHARAEEKADEPLAVYWRLTQCQFGASGSSPYHSKDHSDMVVRIGIAWAMASRYSHGES